MRRNVDAQNVESAEHVLSKGIVKRAMCLEPVLVPNGLSTLCGCFLTVSSRYATFVRGLRMR